MKKQTLTLRISIALNFLLIIFMLIAGLWHYKSKNSSIPIDKITKEDLTNPIVEYYIALDYNNRIYTSVLLKNYNNENIDYQSALGKELGTVIKEDNYWALGEKNEKTEYWGTLYQLKGYASDYRLAIVIDNGWKEFIILDCLNGVELNEGRDIFVSRMKLETYGSYYAKAFENDEETFLTADADYNGSTGDEYVKDFLNELYNAPVLKLSDAIRAATRECRCYKLAFTNEYGINDEITIYESGYAKYENAFNELYFDVADTARVLFLYFDSGLTFTKEELIPTGVAGDTTALIRIKQVNNLVSSEGLRMRLHYNGGLYEADFYTGNNIYDIYEENIIAEELGVVYGHKDGAWSMNKEELPGVHMSGTLYKVRGYGTEERVALIYETKQGMMIYVLDRQ